mgnify:CR=1 FL=1
MDIINSPILVFLTLVILFCYTLLNKFLTIFTVEIHNISEKLNMSNFIVIVGNFISRIIKRTKGRFVEYLDFILFSQSLMAFIFFIFLNKGYYLNCLFVLSLVVFAYKIDNLLYNLYELYDKTIETVLSILEEYDFNTLEHSNRVAFIAKELAKHIGLSYEEITSIELAAKLHDIGKLDIPSFVLNKKTKLTNFEYKLITFHPIISAQIAQNILGQSDLSFIKYHHLYPTIENRRITYRDVPLGARVITIADIYDALRSKRSYKDSLSHDDVIKEMTKDVLKEIIDPDLFEKFLQIYPAISNLYEK